MDIGNCLSYKIQDRVFTEIFGHIDENKDFRPSITESILDIQAIINYSDAMARLNTTTENEQLDKTLKQIAVSSIYLKLVFLYLDKKNKLIKKKKWSQESATRQLNIFKQRFSYDLIAIDRFTPILNEKALLQKFRIRDFCWLTCDVSDDHKAKKFNEYLLPHEYLELFLSRYTT
jgi:hypothetical protein